MVVDDDSTSLAICKAILGNEYDVVAMKSSLEALGYLKSKKDFSVILLDMIMPGTDGMEMLRILKKDKALVHIPVIFLTSMDNEKFEIEGYMNGALDFIKKPARPEILKMKVAREIYISDLRKENQQLKNKLNKIRNQVNKICDE